MSAEIQETTVLETSGADDGVWSAMRILDTLTDRREQAMTAGEAAGEIQAAIDNLITAKQKLWR